MVQSLEIQNFQSHKNTKLEFSPGVNIIVGTSDSGKTAIIRSLRWLTWNRPSGDSLRSYWGGKTSVKASFENIKIERIKDKAEEYIIDVEGSPSKSLKAFGLSVPDDVQSLLNLSEINLQSQLDSPFLLSSTPGEVASHFNKIAKLDKIDSSLQKVEKEIRELSALTKSVDSQFKKENEDLEDFNYIDKFEIELEVLEQMDKDVQILKSNIRKFTKLISSLQTINEQIANEEPALEAEDAVNSLLTLFSLRKEKKTAFVKLGTILNSFIYTIETSEKENILVSSENEVLKIISLIEEKKSKKQAITTLLNRINSFNNISDALTKNSTKLELVTAKFKDSFPDICPLCDSPIKHDHGKN